MGELDLTERCAGSPVWLAGPIYCRPQSESGFRRQNRSLAWEGARVEASQLTRQYPRSLKGSAGKSIRVHRLAAADTERVAEFAKGLDDGDLLFLRVDLTSTEVVEDIVAAQSDDGRVTLIAEAEGEIVGYGGLDRRNLDWMRHLAEIRIIVSGRLRSQGLGSLLVRELFEIAEELGVTKIVARMVREQEGARHMFEKLGFSAEALLTDWAIDRSGKTRDLVIMSYDVTALTN